MIRFTIRLVVRSMRWVGPFLVLLVWVVVSTGVRGTGLELASVLFPAYVGAGIWLTVATGNVDDDPHRDLLAAAIGSASRLHIARTASVLVMAGVVAVGVAILIAVVAEPGRSALVVVLAGTAVSLSGIMIGIGIGTLLHRPVLRHRGLSLLLAILGWILVLLLPPVQSVHRSLNDGNANATWLLLLGASAWASLAVLGASHLSDRRSA